MLVVGAASRDVTAADPRGWQLGGAVTYVSLALARLGVPVRALIGVDSTARDASELALLRGAGVEVALVDLASGPVFENRESPAGRTQVCITPSDPIDPSTLPAGWADPGHVGAVVLGPVAGELGDAWAGVPPEAAFVALGWQGLLRALRAGAVVERREPAAGQLLDRADLVVVSRHDLGPEVDPLAARRLLRPAARLVVTQGMSGGQVSTAVPPSAAGATASSDASRIAASRTEPRPRWQRYRAIPSDVEVDATGAGDVFMAAMVAAGLDRSRIGRPPGDASDVRFAAAAASLSIEKPGLLGVPDRAAVLRRMRRRSTRVAAP